MWRPFRGRSWLGLVKKIRDSGSMKTLLLKW
jgi:hypothetical protein